MTTLKLDWCSHEAAEYAVMKWHYSKRMPKSKLAKIGVWEDDKFVGALVFGVGANQHIGKPYGLEGTQVCELVRVALTTHKTPVSRVLSLALRMLRRSFTGLCLVVSFADPEQGHHGGIYQATNWIYVGDIRHIQYFTPSGEMVHHREVYRYGAGRARRIQATRQTVARMCIKHKYLMPLDDAMRKQIAPLAKPYPKRVTRGTGEIDSAPQSNGETGGAGPTVPLL